MSADGRPIQTQMLKPKDGSKRSFIILDKTSFQSLQDKGLIQLVKKCNVLYINC